MQSKNLYEILELKPNASEVEIKKAYHRLAKVYHPDKCSLPNASEKFQRIQSAYEILIDDKSRQEYQKMNEEEQFDFFDILDKIIGDNIDVSRGSEMLKKYGINLAKLDFEYIQKNLMNFFKSINVGELLSFVRKGIVPKKPINNQMFCSESELEVYDETCAEYYYNLPISIQKVNSLDIKLELNIKLSDITNKNKRKIKIKRKINDTTENTTYVFDITSPYIVYYGAGDINDDMIGNLIIRLILPPNLWWTENLILIEQNMTLYEMIYGLDISLEMGDNDFFKVSNWVPSRDGFYIDVKKSEFINLGIKLYLNYEDSTEKQQILKQYFS